MEDWWNYDRKKKTEVLGEEAVPVPLCPPQITRLTCDRTRINCCKRKATSRMRYVPADISYCVSSEALSNIDCNSLHNTTEYNLVYHEVSKENSASIFR